MRPIVLLSAALAVFSSAAQASGLSIEHSKNLWHVASDPSVRDATFVAAEEFQMANASCKKIFARYKQQFNDGSPDGVLWYTMIGCLETREPLEAPLTIVTVQHVMEAVFEEARAPLVQFIADHQNQPFLNGQVRFMKVADYESRPEIFVHGADGAALTSCSYALEAHSFMDTARTAAADAAVYKADSLEPFLGFVNEHCGADARIRFETALHQSRNILHDYNLTYILEDGRRIISLLTAANHRSW